MPETWDKLFRAVAIRANLLSADTTSALETAYTDIDIGQTELDDRAIEFPKAGIDDALLMAGDRVVRAIGAARFSPYRKDFTDTTAGLASGSLLPLHSNTGVPIVGVVGQVRDGTTDALCEMLDTREEVEAIRALTLKVPPHFAWTDNIRIVHTRTTIKADVVVWDKAAERVKMATSPRGDCNFTEDLHEALICGACATLFRATFNNEQAQAWAQYFLTALDEIRGGSAVTPRQVTAAAA